MAARPARFKQIDVERALAAARRHYGRDMPVAIEPNGRILILPREGEQRAVSSFD